MSKIELDHVSYRYDDAGRCEEVLHDVSLSIREGEFVCIVGESGCGKTTLLRLLAGLAMPSSGEVRIDSAPVTGPGTDRAIVFQNYTLFPWMNARRNVQFGIRQAKPGLDHTVLRRLADEYLDKVDMLHAADKYPYQLSGGMRQRVAIARSLAMDTDILLLDEPFGALDARIRAGLQKLLERLCTGADGRRKTVVFVTHDIHEAVFLADRVVYMTPGRIARTLEVPLPHPRDTLSPADGEQLCAARRTLLGYFDLAYEEAAVCAR